MLKKIINILLRINMVNALQKTAPILSLLILSLLLLTTFSDKLTAAADTFPLKNLSAEPSGWIRISSPTKAETFTLKNLSAEQRGRQVYIFYDLNGSGETYKISLKLSSDGGKTYDMFPKALSGDVGDNLKPGRGKRIIWEVTRDYPRLNGSNFVFAVSAAGEDSSEDCPENMAYIPPGEFTMGCSPGDECDGDEKPAHKVQITKGFCMDKYEVTQGKYKSVMGNNPSYFSNCGSDCPVESVDWDAAKSYCEKAGKRLPTEAEWEYAARAGTTTKYYWGNSMDGNYAWYDGNSGSKTHPVGQKKPNAFGLYDMLGNVWEWVNDWYSGDYYASSPANDPQGATSGDYRSCRGGSWGSNTGAVRVSLRVRDYPTVRDYNLGFRCSQNF